MEIKKPSQEMVKLLVASGSSDKAVALEAQRALAQALTTPLRSGIMSGDIIGGIFTPEILGPGASVEYPVDFLTPGTEGEFTAYTLPNDGTIPLRHVEGDYVQVPTFFIGNAIDWNLKYARDARWNVVARAMEVLEGGIVKKMNDDGWHTLLAAGSDRNILVFDSNAAAGQFTKRLISLLKTVMRRNGGGNSTSTGRSTLTDLYVSPEALEDIRNWGMDQVDEITRREIWVAQDGTINRIFGVNLHDLDELGEGQEYQDYYTNVLSASLQASDVELVVGLDLSVNDSFVHPIREELGVFEDDDLHRRRRAGFYAWLEAGYAVLDNRRVLLGSF